MRRREQTRMPTAEHEFHLKCSVEGLFDFLTRPANVSLVSHPDLGITFTSAPEVLYEGAQLDFQIITFGQVVKSTHLISTVDRPSVVIEKQVKGPMKAWTHRHEYVATDEGVLKRDFVEFELPGGLLGLMLSADKIRDHLEDGFYYRDEKLNELIDQGLLA